MLSSDPPALSVPCYYLRLQHFGFIKMKWFCLSAAAVLTALIRNDPTLRKRFSSSLIRLRLLRKIK